LEGSRAESSRRAKILRSSNTSCAGCPWFSTVQARLPATPSAPVAAAGLTSISARSGGLQLLAQSPSLISLPHYPGLSRHSVSSPK
jgi:hypothetical protein